MRKAGVLLLVVMLVILLYCAGSGTAAAGMQAERARSAKPQVSQVSSGSDFTAAVKADGTLWTWGYDQRAARGINTFRPGQVGSDTNWSTVSAGGNQISAVIAALKSDGTLWTWGANGHGQLGDGTTTPRNEPVQVGKDRDWAAVSAGGNHTAALKRDGTLWTWGWNIAGQLGIGTGGDPRAFASGTRIPPTYADEHLPVQVGKDRDWAFVSAGGWRTVAIRTDGTLWGWGMHGIAAPGVDGIQVRPLRLSRDTDWASVSLGRGHTAALKTDGTLWVWGSNDYGKLGLGIDPVPGRPNTTGTGRPVQVGNNHDWAAVTVGEHHTAALKADGTLWTWGGNMHGQLGDGTLPVGDLARYSPFRNAPTVVSLAPDNGAEARPGAPKMVGLYRRARINDPAALGGELVPFIENGRTMVPLRFLGEQLGAVVRFDSAKKEVTIAKGTVMVQLRLGEKAARISQQGAVPRIVALDVPARAVHGRTVLPLRFVSEALGAAVIQTEGGGIFVLQ